MTLFEMLSSFENAYQYSFPNFPVIGVVELRPDALVLLHRYAHMDGVFVSYLYGDMESNEFHFTMQCEIGEVYEPCYREFLELIPVLPIQIPSYPHMFDAVKMSDVDFWQRIYKWNVLTFVPPVSLPEDPN